MKTKPIIYISLFTGILLLFALFGCNDKWEEHYESYDAQVNMELWEAIRNDNQFSVFVEEMEKYSLDSIFGHGISHTVFLPSNDALSALLDTVLNPKQILLYHISPTLFLSGSVIEERKLQTLTGKYILFNNTLSEKFSDEIPITYTSPLYKDGKYYILDGALSPRPSLYEFTGLYSQIIQSFIDSRDSVFLDFEQSTPIDFDEQGNTRYDSIFGNINLFEYEYFPVSREYRDKSATFILFTQDQYISALDVMAEKTGMAGGRDGIAEKWQLEVLLPRLMRSALFDGMLEYSDLMVGRLESITGDTVNVDFENIDPDSRFLCSNGLTYQYLDFNIDSTIYLNGITREGESLIDTLGFGSWAWKDEIVTTGYISSPLEVESVYASNGSSLNAPFSRGYTGDFSLQFTLKNVLPMRYRLEWRANFRPSGEFEIFVNDVSVGSFDSFKFRSTIQSVTGEYFRPVEGFNRKDFWVENLTEFGDVTIRFVYLGPGSQENNGLNIDYVKLIPEL